MNESIITFFGQKTKVACDGKCAKAWGINSRPKVQLSEDEDDYIYLSDSDLGLSPLNPMTSEGGDLKLKWKDAFPNKWCVRECERCSMSEPGKYNLPVDLKNFNKRIKNIS